MRRKGDTVQNMVISGPTVPISVLLIAPLATKFFSKYFWAEIQEIGFSIKYNWVIRGNEGK
jgi:hypothetical protein